MFGANPFGAPYFGQSAVSTSSFLINLIKATTRFVSGFKLTTRRSM